MSSVVGRGLVFALAEDKVSAEALERVVFDGDDVRYRVVRISQSLLHREQSFPGGMPIG